jgi:tripartite ATP-independent transporter DctM subunit
VSPTLQLAVAFAVFLSLLTVGMAIPFAIGVPAVVYLYLQGGLAGLKGLGLVSWGSMDSFTLMAVPLFILMAEIMQRSGLTLRIYNGLAVLVSRVPGGLLQTSIVGCAIFAAISGSSVVTAASIGGVALPELTRRNYNRPLSAGALAAGGTLGILFPPSTAMIIYGTFTDTSVARLFMAGVVPGLILSAMFMVYIGIRGKLRPDQVPVEAADYSVARFTTAFIQILPFFLLIFFILGSIYSGIATPTEAASIGCIIVIGLSAIFGEFTWRRLIDAMTRTIVIIGNILCIIYTAFVFSYAISYGGVGESFTQTVVSLDLTHTEFFVVLFVLYTVLGCLVESLGMIVITVPLLFPVLLQYGIDPIWFGVILVMFIELGQISPPIGINLFVIQAMWDGKLSQVALGTIPFHIIMLFLLFLLVLFPELALWLPSQMNGAGP